MIQQTIFCGIETPSSVVSMKTLWNNTVGGRDTELGKKLINEGREEGVSGATECVPSVPIVESATPLD